MPRREWLSLTWLLKCSVRLAMRSERMATWTSGEPVSPFLVAYSAINSCLRSGVIIGHRVLKVGKLGKGEVRRRRFRPMPRALGPDPEGRPRAPEAHPRR